MGLGSAVVWEGARAGTAGMHEREHSHRLHKLCKQSLHLLTMAPLTEAASTHCACGSGSAPAMDLRGNPSVVVVQ